MSHRSSVQNDSMKNQLRGNTIKPKKATAKTKKYSDMRVKSQDSIETPVVKTKEYYESVIAEKDETIRQLSDTLAKMKEKVATMTKFFGLQNTQTLSFSENEMSLQ